MSSSSDNSSDDYYVYAIKNKNGDPCTKVTVKVNNVPINFTVDTGATIDLIDSHTYQQLQHKITLGKSHTEVYSYGSDTPIKLKGQFQAQIESKKQYTVSQVHVANGSGGNLLSAKSAQDLGLIQMVNKITPLPQEETETPPQNPICDASPEVYHTSVDTDTLPPQLRRQQNSQQNTYNPTRQLHQIKKLMKFCRNIPPFSRDRENSKIFKLSSKSMKISNLLSNPNEDYRITFAKRFLKN